MADEPTVYIVDDDTLTVSLLVHWLERAGLRAEKYDSAEAFLEHYRGAPGCLVLDVQMPGMSGLELQRKLNERGAELPVIILTGTADVPTAVAAMKGGAVDLIEKPVTAEVLEARVRHALARDAARRDRRAQRDTIEARAAELSAREREVMDLVVAGLANKQIAVRLRLSEKTVEAHRSRVMRKMQADSVAELVRMAVTLDPPPNAPANDRPSALAG
jgi:FixJ family two-component response regulator